MTALSQEEENYVRLALLLKGVTPRAVRTYFDRELLPGFLPSTLSTYHNTLNLTSINPPINGFDSLPLPGEITPGSDLARIKYYRNKLAHHDSNTIDTAYFNTAWRDISEAVSRLGGQTMYKECQDLKVKILDQSNQEIMLEIKQSLEEMKELKLTVDNLGMEHSRVTENLRELQTFHNTLQTEYSKVMEIVKDPIPWNIKESRLTYDGHVTLAYTCKIVCIVRSQHQLIQYLQQLDKPQQVILASTKDTVLPKENCGSGNTPLIFTCYSGYTDMVQWMLHNDVDVDQCREDGITGLLMASQEAHTDIVKLLLEKDPNVDLCNKNGCSPLYWASTKGHTDIVKLLLEKNPNVDLCEKEGFTPLISACIRNYISIVQLLIKHKPNIDAQTFDGSSALIFSALNGHLQITQLLLENNADCNICCCSKQSYIDTIKDHPTKTLEEEKQGCFDYLIKNALPHVADYVSKKSVDYVFDVEAGCSPLHYACFMGRIDIVSCLLDHNANINMTKEDGTTPLFFACEVGHEDIVRLLLDKGADTQICRLDGKSPLTIARDNGHTSIVMMLTNHIKEEDKLSS
ncbi:unnamed protein product [Mytilus edulis]|uniref:DZIP3-like HEPN domain-containing protein n=1 Tax=Mytilus edulis TaxID=6550 RepID=A0A8S3RTU8_MYTED|nr:unnamed protein product [Mytilus edulis]